MRGRACTECGADTGDGRHRRCAACRQARNDEALERYQARLQADGLASAEAAVATAIEPPPPASIGAVHDKSSVRECTRALARALETAGYGHKAGR